MGGPGDLGDDCHSVCIGRRLDDPTTEDTLNDALHSDHLAGAHLSSSMEDCQGPTHSGAGRRSVELPFGEDANTAMKIVGVRGSSGEDDAVEESEII